MKLKAIMWMIFSGTATVCAFFLPGYIWTLVINTKYSYVNRADPGQTGIFFFLLLICALFHTLYRIPVFISDLGFSKTTSLVSKIICSAVFLAAATAFIRLFFGMSVR